MLDCMKIVTFFAFALTCAIIWIFEFSSAASVSMLSNLARNAFQNPASKIINRKLYGHRRGKIEERWGIDVDGFLEKYGYLRIRPVFVDSRKVQIHSKFDRLIAVRHFQEYFWLNATGKLGKRTVKMMTQPRCGLPDTHIDDPYSPIRHFLFYRYYPRWQRPVVTWKINGYTKKISPLALWKTIKKAFDTWSSVSGLRFVYARQEPDIQIDFEQLNHGDGNEIAFDGKGGQAAHAFGPGTYPISGNVHFDNGEEWTLSVNPKRGINILGVAIHEIGHALGLLHSRDPRSVMYPAFISTKLDLSLDDIEAVQIFYGPNPERKKMSYIKPEPTTPSPKICIIPMDDMDLGPDGYVYVFHSSEIKQIDKRGRLVRTKDKISIWDVYKNGPQRVDAVAFSEEKKMTYMFNNNTLWRYTNFDLDKGYPKNISVMPETPNAATFIRGLSGVTRLLLFGTDKFWEWSTGRDAVMKGYPLSTSQYFQGIPKSPSAALKWKDGYIYFFKQDKVFKVHPGSHNVLTGYPKPQPPDWLLDIC